MRDSLGSRDGREAGPAAGWVGLASCGSPANLNRIVRALDQPVTADRTLVTPYTARSARCSLRLAVRTVPSHGANRGSIPLGSTTPPRCAGGRARCHNNTANPPQPHQTTRECSFHEPVERRVTGSKITTLFSRRPAKTVRFALRPNLGAGHDLLAFLPGPQAIRHGDRRPPSLRVAVDRARAGVHDGR